MRKLAIEEMNRLDAEGFARSDKHPVVIVADDIRSFHNIGALFRTADAFRIEHIYLCGISPRPPHREIRKTALGAEKAVSWSYHESILPLVTSLREEAYELLPLEQTTHSTPLSDFRRAPDQSVALIVGHEIYGVKQEVIDLARISLEIPQFGTKHSLNVSVAAGIALYQLTLAVA